MITTFLTIAGGILFLFLLYLFTKKLLGSWWALLPVVMTAWHIFTADLFLFYALLAILYLFSIIPVKFYRISIFLLGAVALFLIILKTFQGVAWLDMFVVYIDKEPIIYLVIILIALIHALINIIRKVPQAKKAFQNYIVLNPEESLMMIFIPIYLCLIVSSSGAESSQIFAITPLVYILAASGIKNLYRPFRGLSN